MLIGEMNFEIIIYLTQMLDNDNFPQFIILVFFSAFVISLFLFIGVKLFYILDLNQRNVTIENINKGAKKQYYKPYEIWYVIVETIISNTTILFMLLLNKIFNNLYQLLNLNEVSNSQSWSSILFIIIEICIFHILSSIWNKSYDVIDVEYKVEQKKNVRLISSICVLVVYIILKLLFSSEGKDTILFSYFFIVLGRFIYFDTTRKDITDFLWILARYSWLVIIIVLYTIIICCLGYKMNIFLNNSLLSAFVCNVCILVSFVFLWLFFKDLDFIEI